MRHHMSRANLDRYAARAVAAYLAGASAGDALLARVRGTNNG